MTDTAATRLLSFVQRWERLQEEKQAISDDQKEVMKEAALSGFDVPALKRLIKLRKLSREERQEQDALDAVYQQAAGMADSEPELPMTDPEERDGRVTDADLANVCREIVRENIAILDKLTADEDRDLCDPPASLPDKVASAVDRLRRGMDAGATPA